MRRLFTQQKTGSLAFTLPVLVIISTALLIIALSLVQTSTSIATALRNEYFNRLANEAAEAGAYYANYCLGANDFVQPWKDSAGKPLTPHTDCSGNALSYAPTTIASYSNYASSFIVHDLESVRDDGAITINSQGIVTKTVGSTKTQVYTTTRKQLIEPQKLKASKSSSGSYKTCAIITGALYCWGLNSAFNYDGSPTEDQSGNLGDGTTNNSKVPVKVVQDPGLLAGKTVTDVASAQHHSCALADGKVYCWGGNGDGQLGDGTTTTRLRPVQATGPLVGKTVTAIGATGNTSCAIAEGKIYCWGANYNGTTLQGSVGNNSTAARITTPTLVYANGGTGLPTNYTATEFATSGSRSQNMCAIAGGKVYCWGDNTQGELGNGTTVPSKFPVAVRASSGDALYGKTVTALAQDGYGRVGGGNAGNHVCAVAGSRVYCWGDNSKGQLGINSTTSSNVPVAVITSGVLSGKNVTDVVAGIQHTCALASGKVYCWGGNPYGQLGTGDTVSYKVPVAVKETTPGLAGKTVTAIGGGGNRGCAVANFQSYCWGLNTNAQLGDGTLTNRNAPAEAIFLNPKAPAYIF